MAAFRNRGDNKTLESILRGYLKTNISLLLARRSNVENSWDWLRRWFGGIIAFILEQENCSLDDVAGQQLMAKLNDHLSTTAKDWIVNELLIGWFHTYPLTDLFVALAIGSWNAVDGLLGDTFTLEQLVRHPRYWLHSQPFPAVTTRDDMVKFHRFLERIERCVSDRQRQRYSPMSVSGLWDLIITEAECEFLLGNLQALSVLHRINAQGPKTLGVHNKRARRWVKHFYKEMSQAAKSKCIATFRSIVHLALFHFPHCADNHSPSDFVEASQALKAAHDELIQHFLWKHVMKSLEQSGSFSMDRKTGAEIASFVFEHYAVLFDDAMLYRTWLKDPTDTFTVAKLKNAVWNIRSPKKYVSPGWLYKVNWELANIGYDFATFQKIKAGRFVVMYDCYKGTQHRFDLEILIAIYQAPQRTRYWPRRSSRKSLTTLEQLVKHVDEDPELLRLANARTGQAAESLPQDPVWLSKVQQFSMATGESGCGKHINGGDISPTVPGLCLLDQKGCEEAAKHYRQCHRNE
jgi:hypothetical protein